MCCIAVDEAEDLSAMFVHPQCLGDLSDASTPKGFEKHMNGRRPRPRGPSYRLADPCDEGRITSGQNLFSIHPPKSTPVGCVPLCLSEDGAVTFHRQRAHPCQDQS
ncbi:hypothetical protein NicSoilC12_19120 [Arthrobacter sp. NicSoilC12]|nr:hypothetical protein NicSoilC12_19120 [Arthrobacter sp. NicSoilC12]